MDFEEWEPWYRKILDYFGFSREQDEEAARLLASLVPRDDIISLAARTHAKEVTVCGNAPCLKQELGGIRGVVFPGTGSCRWAGAGL